MILFRVSLPPEKNATTPSIASLAFLPLPPCQPSRKGSSRPVTVRSTSSPQFLPSPHTQVYSNHPQFYFPMQRVDYIRWDSVDLTPPMNAYPRSICFTVAGNTSWRLMHTSGSPRGSPFQTGEPHKIVECSAALLLLGSCHQFFSVKSHRGRQVSLKKIPAIGPNNPPPESIQVRETHTHQAVRRLASNFYKPILVQETEISAQARGWFICASLKIAAQHEIRPPEPQSSLLGARDCKPNPPTL